MDEISENINKEKENTKKQQSHLNNSISEIKMHLIESTDEIKVQKKSISNLEGKVLESTKLNNKKRKSIEKNENRLREVSNIIKHNNFHIIEI